MRVLFLFICLFYPLPAASDLVLQKRGKMPDQMISDTWKSAKVFVPGLSESEVKFNEVPKETKKHPVVIFMHGCGGINESTLRWGKFLSELGYIAVFPNSYAISGREKYCDTKNQITNAGNANGIAVKNLRANEIRVTKHAVLKTNWADDKNLFLMGHSEGGAGVAFSRGSGFRAVVSSGFKCGKPHPVKRKLPIRVSQQTPILFIYYKNDPWFDYDNCKGFVKKRNNATLLELKGSKHETSSNKIARDAVEEFFAKYRY